MVILAEIEWKPLGDSSSALQQTVDLSPDSEFQATIDIEMTLTKRVPPTARRVPADIHEQKLTDAAFEPKTYKVQLSKGRFTAADWVYFGSGDTTDQGGPDMATHGFQLLFDKSPCPPEEE